MATRLHLYWPCCVSKHTEQHTAWESFREEIEESTQPQLIAVRASFFIESYLAVADYMA